MTAIDIIILIVIAVNLVMGLSRGLVMTIVHCIGGFVSYFAAGYVARRISEQVAALLIVPRLKVMLLASMEERGLTEAADMWAAQSEYLRSLLVRTGLTEDTLTVVENPAEKLAQAIADVVGNSIGYAVVFLVTFAALTILLHFAGRLLNIVSYLPVIRTFNALLGGLLGAAFGLILCTCILWTLKLFVPAVYSDYGLLPPSMMRESVIAGTIVGWNDGVSIFDMIPTDETVVVG